MKDAAQAVYSGVVATFVYQIMFNPAEVLVSRMIIQNKTNWTSVRTTARTFIKKTDMVELSLEGTARHLEQDS